MYKVTILLDNGEFEEFIVDNYHLFDFDKLAKKYPYKMDPYHFYVWLKWTVDEYGIETTYFGKLATDNETFRAAGINCHVQKL